jgi:WD40 repeat protein
LLATGDATGALTLWSLDKVDEPPQRLVGHTARVRTVVFASDGTTLASGAEDGCVLLWRTDPQAENVGRVASDLGTGAKAIALSPNGKTLAIPDCGMDTGGCDAVMLYDLQRHTVDKDVDLDDTPIASLVFAPGGGQIAVLEPNGVVHMRKTRWFARRTYTFDTGPSTARLAYTAAPRTMATVDLEGAVKLWNVRTGETPVTYGPRSGEEVNVTAFSVDGKLWATGYDSGLVTVRELAGGRQIAEVKRGSAISALAFDSQGQMLAIGGTDGALVAWSFAADNRFSLLTGRRSNISALAFSLDGSQLAVGYAGGELLLCSGPGRQPACFPLIVQDDGIVALGFRRDGKQLAVRDDAGTVRIWDLSVDAWVDRARRIANRALSQEEWAQYVASESYQLLRIENEEEYGAK